MPLGQSPTGSQKLTKEFCGRGSEHSPLLRGLLTEPHLGATVPSLAEMATLRSMPRVSGSRCPRGAGLQLLFQGNTWQVWAFGDLHPEGAKAASGSSAVISP